MRYLLLSLVLLLTACNDATQRDRAVVRSEQWSQAELWCRGLEGVNAVGVIEEYEYCGKGCGYKHSGTTVTAYCRTGQAVSQRFAVTKKD